MQIKPHSEMTRDEAIMLWQAERAENEMLRAENAEQARLLGISAERELALTAQLIEARKVIERREAVIAVLERDVRQLELQMESVGAGGVPLMWNRP